MKFGGSLARNDYFGSFFCENCRKPRTKASYETIILQFRVALVCVFLLCFASQGCAGLRILIVFCNSGLRWSAYSYCVLQLRLALVCVFLLCFVTQGCAALRILIVFCDSGLRCSAYSYCVLQFRFALVYIVVQTSTG